jgi:3-oxoadipate enol-lactonase
VPHATINGFDMYYEETGAGDPLIFGHGYAGSHESWGAVLERLSDRYRCIALDFRGAGQSERTTVGYSLPQFADDVIGLADHLDIDRFSYAGLSMGGGIGMQLGLSHPHRLNALMLVAPAPADGITLPAGPGLAGLVKADDRESITLAIAGGFAREVDPAFLDARVTRLMSVGEGHLTGMMQALAGRRDGDRLSEITVPALMVAGAADGLLRPNLQDFLRLPNATLHVFSRAGHQIPLDVPAELAEVLADFLTHGVVTAQTIQARLRRPAATP